MHDTDLSPNLDCPRCLELAEQVKRLTERIDALSQELEKMKRKGKRQAAPFRRKERKKDPKKPGRKKGHRGSRREIPDKVDRILVAPTLDACPDCGGSLKNRKKEENYQSDIPPIEPIVTRFEFESGWCPCCEKRIFSQHEEQISTATGAAACHLGPRILALTADLKARLGIPYRKIVDILRYRFGIRVSAGALSQANDRLAVRAEPTIEAMKQALREEDLAHADETGWRVASQSAWLWVVCSKSFTFYEIVSHRCATVVREILGENYQGILMRDGWRSYDARLDYAMLRCLLHLKRNVQAMEDRQIGQAAEEIALFTLWIDGAFHLRASRDSMSGQEYLDEVLEFTDWLDEFITMDHVSEINASFAERMSAAREHLVPIILDADLPATNNLGERQMRPAVIHRKISGGNKTWKGAGTLASLSSMAASSRQQRRDFFQVVAAILRSSAGEAVAFWQWPETAEA